MQIIPYGNVVAILKVCTKHCENTQYNYQSGNMLMLVLNSLHCFLKIKKALRKLHENSFSIFLHYYYYIALFSQPLSFPRTYIHWLPLANPAFHEERDPHSLRTYCVPRAFYTKPWTLGCKQQDTDWIGLGQNKRQWEVERTLKYLRRDIKQKANIQTIIRAGK